MIAKTHTCSLLGIDAVPVEVEVDISSGLPNFATVGLPDSIVRESKDRVKAALQNSGYPFPMERITVNLAPAHIKKEGSGFDLPIAIGILAALGIVNPQKAANAVLTGELALDGRVKEVSGCLSMAVQARDSGGRDLIVPAANAREAAVIDSVSVWPVSHLAEVVELLNGRSEKDPFKTEPGAIWNATFADEADFEDVKGQEHAKRGLEVAAAGGHNVLMIGPPGSGKTMLAQRISGILPPLSFDEAIETSKIFSVAGMLQNSPLIVRRQFRSPHHTISDAGLVGGGHIPRPGEVSMAHNGVLFLDEFPEFRRSVLDLLRQPLEDGQVTIARASVALTYPARFMLIAAMNPCPCGYSGDPIKPCTCSPIQVQKYRNRISGPILDRIDLHIEVPSVDYEKLRSDGQAEKSSAIRERVGRARAIQLARLAGEGIYSNAQLKPRHIKTYCRTDAACQSILGQAVRQLGLSARAYHRILKVARTVADLEGEESIAVHHLLEAIQYRSLDRKMF
ncbi:MAG: YifB family Mg chelatase-like AAA ATPase [Syntrophobacter sp.]